MRLPTYDNGNQVATWNGAALSTDGNGNVTADSLGSTYAYDERNHLVIAFLSSGWNSFNYDALGRVQNLFYNSGAQTVRNVFDGQNNAQEQYSCCGNVDNLLGLGLDDMFARQQPNGVVESLLRDARNSSIGVVTAGPTVAGQYAYEPFGAATTSYTGGTTNPYWFTGRQVVMNGTVPSNLYQFRNRFYNSRFQRFMSADPIGYDGGQINLYAYVNNDPLNWSDPLGLIASAGVGGTGWGGEQGGGGLSVNDGLAPGGGSDLADPCKPKGFGDGCSPSIVNVRFIAPFMQLPNDPNDSPGPGWQKKDKNWWNPGSKHSLHPDLKHPYPPGPHWDLERRKSDKKLRLRMFFDELQFWAEDVGQWTAIDLLPFDLIP